MIGRRSAITLAEGDPQFKVDAGLVFKNDRIKNAFVLRTSFDSLGVWKAKYSFPASPFKSKQKEVTKQSAIIDNEVWVFDVNGTIVADIVAAVKIGMHCYDIKAEDLLSDIYVKNLNAQGEENMASSALIQANKKLYSGTCEAVLGAARILGLKGDLNFWILSNIKNHKIPKQDLHDALKSGGASSVSTEDDIQHKFWVGANDGVGKALIKSNLHLAKLRI